MAVKIFSMDLIAGLTKTLVNLASCGGTFNSMLAAWKLQHQVHLVIPSSTINARRYSYFVRVCEPTSLDLLKIDNCNLFRHTALKHFCNTF